MNTPSPLFHRAGSVKPWYAQTWPWLLMLGPALVILAGSYTCWLAFSRPDALVVDDYYQQGKAINQDLRRNQAATSLGLTSTLRYDPTAGKIIGTLTSFGKPVKGKIRLLLVHSTQPKKDIILEAEPDSQGEFSLALPMLEKTRWRVLIENEKRDWRLTGTWMWPQQSHMDISADIAALN